MSATALTYWKARAACQRTISMELADLFLGLPRRVVLDHAGAKAIAVDQAVREADPVRPQKV